MTTEQPIQSKIRSNLFMHTICSR